MRACSPLVGREGGVRLLNAAVEQRQEVVVALGFVQAIKQQLHVARSLELLEDDLVHAAAGIDQGGRDDGDGPTPTRRPPPGPSTRNSGRALPRLSRTDLANDRGGGLLVAGLVLGIGRRLRSGVEGLLHAYPRTFGAHGRRRDAIRVRILHALDLLVGVTVGLHRVDDSSE